MHNKKFTFPYSLRRKCISNLRTLPMHFRQDFAKYKTSKGYENNSLSQKRNMFNNLI